MSDKPNDDRNAFGAITSVAHELRTPLTAIQGAVEILNDEVAGPLTPAQREFVNLAYRNLARLKDRIEDALDIASCQGAAAPPSAIVALDELAKGVAGRSAIESGPGLKITFRGFDGGPCLSISAGALCRTLASLIGTIGRHTGSGEAVAEATQTTGRIRFEVSAKLRENEAICGAVIHDASLALASEVISLHEGSLTPVEPGRCGVYVLLPLQPIWDLEDQR